jgi:tetratricopeptide (TPR) repeat protein
MVREACGEAAYAAEHYKDALAELKAARRMNGSAAYLPMIADCERALGRPERALKIAKEATVEQLDDAGRVELVIVEAGARRDLGDIEAALRTLEGSQLRSRSRAAWVARLRYAYADALLAAGRAEEAREWFERTAGVDAEGRTDATERLAELEGLTIVDLDPDEE